MPALTRFALRHKVLVTLLWLVLAAAGVATIGGTTHRMTNDFSMPGQAFRVNNQIAAQYGNGGSQAPYVAVLTVAPGQRVSDPAIAAETGRVFEAVREAAGSVRMTDFDLNRDRRFITANGRSTFALLFTPAVTGFGGADLSAPFTRAAQAELPAGWHFGLTGSVLLANGTPASGGTGLPVEAAIGSVGALVILVLVFGSLLAPPWPRRCGTRAERSCSPG